jgi:3-dehydroquinate synthase
MRQVDLNLEVPYSVRIGHGILHEISLPHRKVAVLADGAVAETYGNTVAVALSAGGSDARVYSLPPGEDAKAVSVYEGLLSTLARDGLTRDSAVVSVGGGAASDLAGFVAATYLRGIAFYTVPTTLLAMVDAAVGGKTGVNLPEGKNLAGAFHQPRGVWADLDTLATLPDRVFREGTAEVFKHGLLANPGICRDVLAPLFGPNYPGLEATVEAAVRVKAEVVARDPFEKGERAYLNFGHTLAHAFEAFTHREIPHGEAVAYGMHYAAHLSYLEGGTDLSNLTRAFLTYQRPRPLPPLDLADLLPYMARDKKADDEGLRFVLLRGMAQPYLARVGADTIERAWTAFQKDLPALAAEAVG